MTILDSGLLFWGHPVYTLNKTTATLQHSTKIQSIEAVVRPNMLNMPKSASGAATRPWIEAGSLNWWKIC